MEGRGVRLWAALAVVVTAVGLSLGGWLGTAWNPDGPSTGTTTVAPPPSRAAVVSPDLGPDAALVATTRDDAHPPALLALAGCGLLVVLAGPHGPLDLRGAAIGWRAPSRRAVGSRAPPVLRLA
jgi:hypothetical protein